MDLAKKINEIGTENEKSVFELLESLSTIDVNANIDYIITLLRETSRQWIINGCSLALSESSTKKGEVKSVLLEKLRTMNLDSDISTVVFACSHFDYSNELRFFTRLTLLGSDEVVISAKSVINAMKNLARNDYIEAYYMMLNMKKRGKVSSLRNREFNELKGFFIKRIDNKKVVNDIEFMFK